MSFLNIFKKKIKTRILEANATLYPDKILLCTTDRVKDGFGISSLNISLLPVDIDNETLGQKLRYHLSLTRTDLPIPQDYKKAYNEFLTKAGFKNGKEHHKDALFLMVSQQEKEILISPTKNGGFTGKERGFLVMNDVESIKLPVNIDDLSLGNNIRDGWSKCK